MTLYPGTIITTGTPDGVALGMKNPKFLNVGDELNLKVDNETIKDRLKNVVKPEPMFKSGVLGKYTKLVQPAAKGAVTG